MSFPPILEWKNEFFTNSDYTVQIHQKIGRVPCFFRIIKFEHSLNTILVPRIQRKIVQIKNVLESIQRLSMFVTWIVNSRTIPIILTLLVFQVIVSCSRRVSGKNIVFRLFARIASKLTQKIKRKKIKDQDFLQEFIPKNPKFHRLDFFFSFSYSQEKSHKICVSFIWFLEFFVVFL